MARLYALQLADQRAMEKQGVRENPIRRNGYSGGAAPTQPVRFELASERAEEIQANRTNPRRSGATPTMGVSQVRGGYTGEKALKKAQAQAQAKTMRGGRAVPSAGLSQFRGGSDGRMVGAGRGSDSDSDSCDSDSSEEYGGGARDMEVLAREKAPRPAIRSGLSAQHSAEAKEMGQHLGKHLIAVRGGGFFDLFTKGIVEAGQQGESFAKQTGEPNPSPPPPPTGIMTTTTPPAEEPKGGALFHRKRDMLGEKEEDHEEHTARRFGMTRKGGFLSGQYEGMGESGGRTKRGKMMRKQKQIEEGNQLHTLEDDFPEREGREATHGDRTSGKKRTMVFNRERGAFGTNTEPSSSEEESSSGSGRASRAAIVKKVMAEKGCSMIEASKYVKAHGLYKGGMKKRKASTSPDTLRARVAAEEEHIARASRAAAAAGEEFGRERAIDAVVRAGTPPRRAPRSPPRMVRRRGAPSPSTPAIGPAGRMGRRLVFNDSPPRLPEVAPAAPPAAAAPVARRARSGAFDMADLADALPDTGKGRKKRRSPAGPSDGRRKRAEIVKKVMAEKGMKMIEASKYVKAHKLY